MSWLGEYSGSQCSPGSHSASRYSRAGESVGDEGGGGGLFIPHGGGGTQRQVIALFFFSSFSSLRCLGPPPAPQPATAKQPAAPPAAPAPAAAAPAAAVERCFSLWRRPRLLVGWLGRAHVKQGLSGGEKEKHSLPGMRREGDSQGRGEIACTRFRFHQCSVHRPLDYTYMVWCYLRQSRCKITKQHKQQVLKVGCNDYSTLVCMTSLPSLPPSVLPAQGPCSISRALPGILSTTCGGGVAPPISMIDTSVQEWSRTNV